MSEHTDSVFSVLFIGVIAFIALFLARKNDFFSYLVDPKKWIFSIGVRHVLIGFFLYFGVSFFITPVVGKALETVIFNTKDPFLSYSSWINFINSSLIFLALGIFFFSSKIKNQVWKHPDLATVPYAQNLKGALLTWAIAFPSVLFVNQLIDFLLYSFFGLEAMPEQLAVYFLKQTLGHPLYATLAVSTIVLFAPLIEELLFRGLLQSYIRQKLGSFQAITITSFLFAFFHYSPEQGLSNLTIILSLFSFSLFISFIYEKQGTLISPIFLHALFNLVNVVNLLFLGDTSHVPV